VPSPKQTGKNSRNEYKDSESLDSPEKSAGSGNGYKAPLPSKSPTTKQPISTRPIKKVDLGAAATFAKEAKEVYTIVIKIVSYLIFFIFSENQSSQHFK